MLAIGRPVHLWIYNHPFHGISDQVEFFVLAMREHGFRVTVSRHPHPTALNVVIENFSQETSQVLVNFCTETRKRVAVIMTEHLDFVDGQLYIHGEQLWTQNDYMHPATQVARIRNLLDCVQYIRCFLTLGDLPVLRGFGDLCPGVSVRTIPFPALSPTPVSDVSGVSPEYDVVFTGFMTSFRKRQLEVMEQGLFVLTPGAMVSRHRRDACNRQARVVLNLPQRENWRWISLMRVFAALRCGRATVSIGTVDDSCIAACCPQLDTAQDNWRELLESHIMNWKEAYSRSHAEYLAMATEFKREHDFPFDLFEYWALVEDVKN